MRINKDPHLDSVQNGRSSWSLSLKWDVYIIPLSSRLRDLHWRGGRKMLRAGGGWWLEVNSMIQTQQDWCTSELTETVGSTVPTRQNPNREKSMGTPASAPNQEAVLNCFLLGKKKKIHFLQWNVTGYISHIPNAQGQLDNSFWYYCTLFVLLFF